MNHFHDSFVVHLNPFLNFWKEWLEQSSEFFLSMEFSFDYMSVSKWILNTNPSIAHQDLFHCPVWYLNIRSDGTTQIACREELDGDCQWDRVLSAQECVTPHEGTGRVYVFVFWVCMSLENLRPHRLPFLLPPPHKAQRWESHIHPTTSVARLAYLSSDSKMLRGRFDELYLSPEGPCVLISSWMPTCGEDPTLALRNRAT